MLAYLTILTTTLSALAGAPWWAAIACGCLLALISIAEQQRTGGRIAVVGQSGVLATAGLASLANGLAAGGAAYAGGWLLRFM